jgi:putative acetyltransferase
MTLVIRPIKTADVTAARDLILAVAHSIFAPGVTLDSFREVFLGYEDDLTDVAAFETIYRAPDGLFLVVLDGEQLIGTGAVRRLDNETAEIKRMWLNPAYHGQGIGYRVLRQLLAFAREQGYREAYLTTSSLQTRAIAFYERVGFQRVTDEAGAAGFAVAMRLTL